MLLLFHPAIFPYKWSRQCKLACMRSMCVRWTRNWGEWMSRLLGRGNGGMQSTVKGNIMILAGWEELKEEDLQWLLQISANLITYIVYYTLWMNEFQVEIDTHNTMIYCKICKMVSEHITFQRASLLSHRACSANYVNGYYLQVQGCDFYNQLSTSLNYAGLGSNFWSGNSNFSIKIANGWIFR